MDLFENNMLIYLRKNKIDRNKLSKFLLSLNIKNNRKLYPQKIDKIKKLYNIGINNLNIFKIKFNKYQNLLNKKIKKGFKLCIECNFEKEIYKFDKHNGCKDGYRNQCRECRNKQFDYLNNIIENKTCNECNKNKEIIFFHKKIYKKDGYSNKCRECIKKQIISKSKIKNIEKVCYKCNFNFKVNFFIKDKYTKDGYKNICKKCFQIKYQLINNKKNKIKYNEDLMYKTYMNVRSRLRSYLNHNNIQKNNTTIKSIGITKKLFIKWIKFNLKIDNLQDKDYHLDHLQPLSSYICKTYDEVIESKCNHWTNIIPTTPEYNLYKSDREPTLKEKFKQDLRICIFKIKYLKNGI